MKWEELIPILCTKCEELGMGNSESENVITIQKLEKIVFHLEGIYIDYLNS